MFTTTSFPWIKRDRFVSHFAGKIRKTISAWRCRLSTHHIAERKMNELVAAKDNIVIQCERRVMQPASAGHVHSWKYYRRHERALFHTWCSSVSREMSAALEDSHLHDMRFLPHGWLIRIHSTNHSIHAALLRQGLGVFKFNVFFVGGARKFQLPVTTHVRSHFLNRLYSTSFNCRKLR